MALASWLRLPKFSFASAPKALIPRQPLRSRPSLEYLEDRMLLSAAGSNNQLGVVNNPTVFNFNATTAGLTLPNVNQVGNPQGNSQSQLVNGFQASPLGAQADLLAQSQLYGQFRAFGVNSQGEGNLRQISDQQIVMDAFGFGSGTWPNRPWVPAAYNLGLANHQYGFPSQADMGFMSAPPWTHQYGGQHTQSDRLADEATWMPEHQLINQSTDDREQDQQNWRNEDEREKPPQWEAPLEKSISEEQSAAEKAASSLTRGDPTTENALFNDSVQTLTIAALATGLPAVAAPAEGGEVAADMGASE